MPKATLTGLINYQANPEDETCSIIVETSGLSATLMYESQMAHFKVLQSILVEDGTTSTLITFGEDGLSQPWTLMDFANKAVTQIQ